MSELSTESCMEHVQWWHAPIFWNALQLNSFVLVGSPQSRHCQLLSFKLQPFAKLMAC